MSTADPYEPTLELLGSMDFGQLFSQEAFIWFGPPMLIYLEQGRLMNKATNETVTLKATTDREWMGELIAHGWRPTADTI